MATNTTNYNFKKPDESDFYSVQDQNNNWDKADAALKDLDTPTFEDYSGSTTVPDAATAINNIKSKGKLSTIVSNVKAAFKGACLIGQIVNNCVTNNAKLPLSAAQGKALMDLYTQLNSDLAIKSTFSGTKAAGIAYDFFVANFIKIGYVVLVTLDIQFTGNLPGVTPAIVIPPEAAPCMDVFINLQTSDAMVVRQLYVSNSIIRSADVSIPGGIHLYGTGIYVCK